MSNWCDNRMIIRGKKEEVKQLLDIIKGKDECIDFEKIIPITAEGEKDLWKWCIQNWEAGGNAINSSLVIKNTRPFEEAEIQFDTPSGCPVPIFKKMSKMFPEIYFLTITTEPNMGWGVVFELKYGKIQTILDGEYHPFAGDYDDQTI